MVFETAKYIDPDGRAVETPWDAYNVGMGVVSLTANLVVGNYGKAAVDAVGIVADSIATVVPVVPGGAATGIQLSRAASTLAANKVAGAAATRAKLGSSVAGEQVTVIASTGERSKALRHTALSQAQPSTVINKLFKIAVQVRQTKQRIVLHLPSACAVKSLLHTVSERLFICVPANIVNSS